MACLSLVDRVMGAFEESSFAVCVFLDFSACFDTICRSNLMTKLNQYGIRGVPLELIKSYFSNRRQCVYYGGSTSLELSQEFGVIQGSKNGPLFYDIYSNDLNYLCAENENICFADDTCLIYVGSDLESLASHVNNRLSLILDWCKYNKLMLNPAKTEYMILTNKVLPFEPVLRLDDNVISRKTTVKYLGLNLDEKLKFTVHVDSLKTKLARLSGVTYRLHNYFNYQAAKNFYYSCVYSSITYCIAVWGGALSSYRGRKLIKLHNKIVRNLFSKFNFGRCPFKSNKLLKLVDIHKYYSGIHMFKIINLNQNDCIRDTIDLHVASHTYSTRARGELLLPFPRVNAIKISHKSQFITVWNEIPDHVKQSPSLRIFKRNLTNYLVGLY